MEMAAFASLNINKNNNPMAPFPQRRTFEHSKIKTHAVSKQHPVVPREIPGDILLICTLNFCLFVLD